MPENQMKKYDVIVLDPPWEYLDKQGNDPARGGITYPVLTMKDLYDIPLGKCSNDNALMFCWVTAPKLVDLEQKKYSPLSIIRQWGFRPVTFAFVWIKTYQSGKLYSGLGRYTNSNAEYCIVARKGKALPRLDKSVKQIIETEEIIAPIGKHSAKPKEQYERIERLYGKDWNYLELFARKENPPPSYYDATGLDFDGVDIREWIKQYV